MANPLTYKRGGTHYYRCAWCNAERDVRTFPFQRVLVDQRTVALLCEGGVAQPGGEVVRTNCGRELTSVLPAIIARAGKEFAATAAESTPLPPPPSSPKKG